MNLSQFFTVLRVRYKIALVTVILTVLTTGIVSYLLPKSYKATSTVIINYKGADPVTGLAMPSQLMPAYMATQVNIISSMNVAKRVIASLQLAESPAVQQNFQEATGGAGDINNWLGDLLLRKLDVRPSRESSLIDISFEGTNPQFAAAIANAFSNAYMQTSIELKVDPSKKAAQYFTSQIEELRTNLERAQQKLSDYQQDKGIISVDERLDVERARLNELSSQLVMAQAQTMEAQSRERNAAGSGAFDSPDVAANPIIQNLKTEIARAESKFAEISQKYERNHPMYQGAKAEIENLKQELNTQVRSASGNVASNSKILTQRENAIRAALTAQRSKVLELNRDRDALAVLTREVENAQRAYDIGTQRFTETNIEGQSNQSDIALLNPAVAPLKPSSPNIVLNLAAAIVLGSLLGLGFALLAELLDRRVRSASDLFYVIQAPVLGELDKERSKPWLPLISSKKSFKQLRA